MKLDVLAFGAHPDDVEMTCGGTLLKLMKEGKKAGIVDLTRGELGTRGSAEIRSQETDEASKILGIAIRENLGFADGFFQNDEKHQMEIVKMVRKYRPDIVLCNAIQDRHPDHGRASKLVSDACFLSGLVKLETTLNNVMQQAWRPKAVYHYIQDRPLKPDFVVDVTDVMEQRMKAVHAYKSQFYDPNSKEPETTISTSYFMDYLLARLSVYGRSIGVKYAEGYNVERVPGVKSLFDLE